MLERYYYDMNTFIPSYQFVFAYDLDRQPSFYRVDPFLIWRRVNIVFCFWQLIIGIKCWMVL